MTYDLRFLPEVEEDAIAAYSWYEEKAGGLGEDFLRMFYTCANDIARAPLINQKTYGEFRRRLLRRFPYAIYFRIEQNEILVVGLFHCARDPRTIRLSLSDRDK